MQCCEEPPLREAHALPALTCDAAGATITGAPLMLRTTIHHGRLNIELCEDGSSSLPATTGPSRSG
jgi:hypothetical protein